MKKIPVLVSGLPGKMATMVVERLLKSDKYAVVPVSLTGEGITTDFMFVDGLGEDMMLAQPSFREKIIGGVMHDHPGLIAVDYSHPSAVNDNAKFFCERGIPFVMGTTGGDRDLLRAQIMDAGIPAVVSRNMSIPVVLMMAMVEYAAKNFPGVLKDFMVYIEESHQCAKADPSGTAKTIGDNLKMLGADYSEDSIRMIRNPREQLAIGVPREFLDGHGYHIYGMISPDDSVDLGFSHNVRGRDTYIDGTVIALDFLVSKIANGEKGYYDMIDVMRAMQA